MRTSVILPALALALAGAALAGNKPAFERIAIAAPAGHAFAFQGLNDRGEVLASDCDYAAQTCDLILWTERDGKRVVLAAARGLLAAALNEHGHIAVMFDSGPPNYQTSVQLRTGPAGWQTITGLRNLQFFNNRDMIFDSSIPKRLWERGEFFTLLDPPGGSPYVTGMNDSGMVVGGARFEPCSGWPCYERPFYWTPSTGVVDLGGLPGLPSGNAYSVNDVGHIAGILYDANFSTTRHIFFWTPKDGMVEVGACYGCTSPTALNKHDELAGNIYSFAIRTYFWSRKTGFFDIGTLGGIGARMAAMNDRGEIVGESSNSNGVWRAFVWSQKDGMIDLSPDGWGNANRINNHGLITGFSDLGPTVWKLRN
jgi:probable HAF family extracellular repeat protein